MLSSAKLGLTIPGLQARTQREGAEDGFEPVSPRRQVTKARITADQQAELAARDAQDRAQEGTVLGIPGSTNTFAMLAEEGTRADPGEESSALVDEKESLVQEPGASSQDRYMQ